MWLLRGDVGSRLAKWLVFSVLLSLLPIGARIAASSFSGSALTANELLKNGELLVLATVLTAAAIGDLVFDLNRLRESPGRVAGVVTVNLLVLLVSVLYFGLVTLDNENRSAQLAAAQRDAALAQGRADQLVAQADQLRDEADRLRRDSEVASDAARAEALLAQSDVWMQRAELERRRGDETLARTAITVSVGHSQAAVVSLILFGLALLAGLAAIWAGTSHRPPITRVRRLGLEVDQAVDT